MINRKPISAEQFDKAAKASKSGGLKRRNGQFGVDYSIWINSTLVMLSEVDKDGKRCYWSYL